jgi:hypothetical protein
MRNEATKNAIFTLEGRIAETTTTHAYFLRIIHGLEARLLSMRRQRNSLTNQIAPISSLPNELLIAIFEHCYPPSPSLRTGPPIEIILSHVNQQFRGIAMNTRLFWARIEVSFRTPFDKVIAYLQRSRTSPFDLYFDIDTHLGSGSDSQLDPDVHLYTISEWETIMSHMTRCRRLSARCNEPEVVDDMINRLHMVNAPLLQSLQIECHYEDVEPHVGPYRKIIDSGAPALTAVRLKGWGLQQCLPPLTGVTSLTLLEPSWGMAWSDLRDILGGCLSLTHLVIGDIFAADIPDNFESTIILPILRSLGISANDYDVTSHIEQILLAISAPVLESLIMNDIVEEDLVDVSQLQNSDRFPCLRYLSISLLPGEQIGQESWTLFCSVFPRITHFTLRLDAYESVGAEDLITALAYTPAESASPTLPLILPELNTLSFGCVSARAAMLLCDLVSKWHAAGWPLRLLQLPMAIFHDEAFAGSLDHLRALIEVKEYQSDGDQIEGVWNWS